MRKIDAVVWALTLLVGATAAGLLPKPGPLSRSRGVRTRTRALTVAAVLVQGSNRLAAARRGGAAAVGEGGEFAGARQLWRPRRFRGPRPEQPPHRSRHRDGVATISAPDGATKLLRVAMARPSTPFSGRLPTPAAPRREGTALAALEAAAPSANSLSTGVTTYGELEPDIFAPHRLTILQLGDSHTAADILHRPGARASATSLRNRRRRLSSCRASRMSACARRCSRATPPTVGPTRRCRSRTPSAAFISPASTLSRITPAPRSACARAAAAATIGSRSLSSSSPAAAKPKC